MDHLSDSQLNEYLDQTLPLGIRRQVSAHLGACSDCRARLDELQLLFDCLADLPEVRLSHDLTPAILSRLPRKQTHLWTPILAGQFIAALGILLWFSSKAMGHIRLPAVPGFLFPQFSLSQVIPSYPAIDIRSVTVHFLFMNPKFQDLANFPFRIPAFNLPPVLNWADPWPAGGIHLSNFPLLIISIVALLIWLLVNAALLRKPLEIIK